MNSKIANCPHCKSFRSIELNNNKLCCKKCSFELNVLCPFCGVGQLNENDGTLNCQHCSRHITTNKLAYILSNRLMVNTDERCQYCNSPTLS